MAINWNYTGKRGLVSKLFTGGLSGAITGGFGIPGFLFQAMFFHNSSSTVEIKRLKRIGGISLWFGSGNYWPIFPKYIQSRDAFKGRNNRSNSYFWS